MLLKHCFTPKIAHSSYILAGSGTCAVIDPRRDVDLYIDEARALGVRITHILETHLHADFVSGHLDLAERTGATIYAPASADCAFEHVALKEGDSVQLEHLRLDVLETPGHTPEHIVYVVTDTTRAADDPIAVFTGDVLFVGDVGRPDLFPGQAHELASKLFDSLNDKVLALPDHVEVYPAHGAGSLCGRSMSSKWTSTIGYERRHNPALQFAEREAFIASLTNDMPPAPDHFSRCSEINRVGPRLVSSLSAPEPLRPQAFARRLEERAPVILDVRNYDAFGGHHLEGALNFGLAGNLPTFVGWLLGPDAEIAVVADNASQVSEAVTWARRVGIDGINATLEGGMNAWANAGLDTVRLPILSSHGLQERILGDDQLVLLDVRAEAEFAEEHIEGAINIPAPDLRTRHGELDPARPTCVICSTGNRSGMAASMLQGYGFGEVYNVASGMTGYAAAGLSKQCTICVSTHGARVSLDVNLDVELI
jgi:glyoxylase-like metal-dependent hydrolase (beta-lactamase superfamily II)/rhodanese-related sulfurtransferase